MKLDVLLSKTATFVSLSEIARNVPGVVLQTIESLPAKACVFASDGNQISICHEDKQISFPKDYIKGFDIVPVAHAGATFYAATIEFNGQTQSLRYGIVISPKPELSWLLSSAEKIGEVLSQAPLDRTQTSE